MIHHPLRLLLIAPLALWMGCVNRPEDEVVVYCALDQEFAAPILAAFERGQEGKTKHAARYDVESTKTVGLVNRILAEKGRPQCDVFWNNEILHTIRLQQAGLLESGTWKIPTQWPVEMRAKDGTWCGFAARARVLLVNRERLPNREEWPHRVQDLSDPKWKDRCGVARPLFGTTATHFVVLQQVLGEVAADQFYQAVSGNAVVLSGNKQVAQAVSSGKLAWGLTDTDDAVVEIDHGLPVEIVWPDQGSGEPGVLRIPNTVAVLKGSPHPTAARTLAEFLVSPLTEERLAMGDSAQLPVGPTVEYRARIESTESVRWMPVDFELAAKEWEVRAESLAKYFP